MATGHRRRGTPPGAPSKAADDAADDTEYLAGLLVRAKGGDGEALSRIVEACTPMVVGVAARCLPRRADAEDVAQDVWLTLTRTLGRITNPMALRGWLVTVTTHAAWRAARRERHLVPIPEAHEPVAGDDTESEATGSVYATDVGRGVRMALGRLRPCDRSLLELLAASPQPDYQAVSRATGRPVGSIGPTRQRAIARLRRDPELQVLAPAL
jgi:RNA polymerase sigma factor (sigma-70 family)